MAAQITNFRLSFIWTETVPAVLARTLDAKQPFAFLGAVGGYAERFDAVQRGADAQGLTVPWLGSGNHYWKYSFARQRPAELTGATAWKYLVPLRASLPVRNALASGIRTTFEAFYSPTGIALVANAYYRKEARSPIEIAELAHFFRYQAQFNPPKGQSSPKSLTAMADKLIGNVRLNAFGATPSYSGSNQPFSIATVVQAKVDDPTVSIAAGSDEHRALAAVSTWKQEYKTMPLGAEDLQTARLEESPRASSDFVYASQTGRAVWLPREFTRTGMMIRRMSCYHRNLTLCVMQTLLLGEFVDRVYQWHREKQPTVPLLLQRAQQAAALLDKSVDGDRTLTYRTRNIQRIIDGANWRGAIDYVKTL